MERQSGNRWSVGSCLLGHPESLRYRSVTILRIGRSAGNPFAESPQRPYAARPTGPAEGEEMVQTATALLAAQAGESRCGRLIPRFRVRVPGGPLPLARTGPGSAATLESSCPGGVD